MAASLDVTLNRNSYIGGSDIAAVMGLSRYKTPLKIWAEKTGKIEPADLSAIEAVQLGSDLEEFVAAQFTKATGKSVRKAPRAYTHKDYPFMVAHIDRLVTGTDELLECKTCNAFKADEWKDEEIPQEYILQVMWYLGITGRRIGHIACLIGGQKFVYKEIKFDSELFDRMVEAAKAFWEAVLNNTPVAVSSEDDATLQELYSEHTEFMIEMFPIDERTTEAVMTFEEQVNYLQEIKAHIISLKAEQKEIEQKLKDVIQSNLGIVTPKYTITWKKQTTCRFDTDRFKENNPLVAEQYIKTTTTRRLLIKKNDKENN